MAKNRYVGEYPVIGIRPTIDGRRGVLKVRESLEDQTMNMAKAAAELFTSNLKYSNGEPVKVVIADTTIGRVAEAAACEEKFKKAGVSITLTVTPCWCYGAETMDMDRNTLPRYATSLANMAKPTDLDTESIKYPTLTTVTQIYKRRSQGSFLRTMAIYPPSRITATTAIMA